MVVRQSTRPGASPARAKAAGAASKRGPAKTVASKAPKLANNKATKVAAKAPKVAKKAPKTAPAKTATSKAAKPPVSPKTKPSPAPKPPRKKVIVEAAPAEAPPGNAADIAAPTPHQAAVRRGVARRRDTVARTRFTGDLLSVAVDPDDPAALALVARQAAGWERARDAAAAGEVPSARRKRSATERAEAATEEATGAVLIDRVSRSIERELGAIEKIIDVRPKRGMRSETERRARTLANLTRTLAELRRLRAAQDKRPLDDDAVPRDLDELRRALSRRLDQMVAAAKEVSAAGDE